MNIICFFGQAFIYLLCLFYRIAYYKNIFIIAIFIIGVSVIGGILRAIFGFGRRSRPTPHTYATSGERRQQQSSQRREEEEEVCNTEENIHPRKHKKIFTKDEGEYVDFEEIN